MNAGDYLAKSQQFIDLAIESSDVPGTGAELTSLLYAGVFVLMAIAIELGVPPVQRPAGGSTDGQ